jgi:Uma2 family endonuclease
MGLVLEHDPDTIRAPDIALFTVSKPFDECDSKYPEELPALAVEVLSPSDRFSQKVRRFNKFLDKGVSLVWLVDPEDRSVVVWWRGQSPISFEEPAEIANLPGLADFRCLVADIFFTPGRR